MLPALATLAELEARLGLDDGTLTGADRARAQAALDDASALVREEAQQDFVAEDGSLTVPDVVKRVVLGAALRSYRNPDAQIAEAAGPFSRTLKSAEVSVYLTDAEKQLVRRYRPTPNGLWTMKTERDDTTDRTLWMEDSFGFELFPIGFVDEPWR